MKLLVVRFSSIGDIVLTSPVLRALRAQRPDCELHVATKAGMADLVRYSPHVAAVHALDRDWAPFIAALRRERFDALIDLHGSLRSWHLARLLGIPHHGYAKRNLRRWVLVTFKRDLLRGEHVVSRYFRAVRRWGVHDDGQGLELHIPEGRAVDRSVLPEPHRDGYIALAIGAAHATKRLPAHRMVDLARAIDGPVVLVGGAGERAVAAQIVAALGVRAFDATGRFDLLASASLIRGATAVVAHDSAAMHMATAFHRPLVSIWGSTIPALGMGPYRGLHPAPMRQAEVQGVACRPCTKIGRPSCPKGHFACMERHDIGEIVQLIRSVRAEVRRDAPDASLDARSTL